MVGSEHLLREELAQFVSASPSPHGRVGTDMLLIFVEILKPNLSPSPHGRVGTMLLKAPHTNIVWSPSPHGRVGTMLDGDKKTNRRNLAVPSWSGRNLDRNSETSRRNGNSRRPLMVGSEHNGAEINLVFYAPSPSPHGRVGTFRRASDFVRKVKSPSPHGRVGT